MTDIALIKNDTDKIATSVRINRELFNLAKANGLNLSKALEYGISEWMKLNQK